MFGGSNSPSVADIAAVTGNNGFGGWGDGWWALIILFALFGGYGRGGLFGGNGGCACDSALYWSHRRVGDRRGSLAGIIVLK